MHFIEIVSDIPGNYPLETGFCGLTDMPANFQKVINLHSLVCKTLTVCLMSS